MTGQLEEQATTIVPGRNIYSGRVEEMNENEKGQAKKERETL